LPPWVQAGLPEAISAAVLDLYCERTAPGFWAEPVNAVTNLGFVVAAWMIWRLARREQTRDASTVALIAMIVAIGLGSFLFHTLANEVTRWLDILPIFAFQLLYLGIYCRRVIVLPLPLSCLLSLLLLLAAMAAAQLAEYQNGSLIYAPAWLAILFLGWYHYRGQKPGRILLLITTAVFLIALALRSIDIEICGQFATGTHFLWHLLNALVIYLAMLALILNLAAHRSRPA
jgi:hypothetical protein